MSGKITRDVLEAHPDCKIKGHLKQAGEAGIPSDYAALLVAAREQVRREATDKITARCKEGEVARDITLTAAALKTGPLFILDAIFEDDDLAIRIDGLKRGRRKGW
jgi:hypothetical protein